MALVTIIFFVIVLFTLVLSYALFFKQSNKLLIIAIVFILVFLLLLGFTSFHSITLLNKSENYQQLGPYGDYIGGILNPLIAVFGVFAAGFAFYAQYEANRQVQRQFKIQQFESQFYEMIRLQRANIEEMEIANSIHGRKCFVRMFYEFKYIYLSLVHIYKFYNPVYNWNFEKREFCNISYLIFFYGIGSVSNRVVLKQLDEKYHSLAVLLIDYLDTVAFKEWESSTEKHPKVSIDSDDGAGVFTFEMFYYPFDGHNTRLGHYFRHLYQTVSFVVNSEIITDRQIKYKYLKLLRAQLSNHEQLLLYYNSLSKFGSGWIENKYFSDYKMIKNIPLDFADFGITPKDLLGNTNDFGESIFEWDELCNN